MKYFKIITNIIAPCCKEPSQLTIYDTAADENAIRQSLEFYDIVSVEEISRQEYERATAVK